VAAHRPVDVDLSSRRYWCRPGGGLPGPPGTSKTHLATGLGIAAAHEFAAV
jgi:hypothetical protein